MKREDITAIFEVATKEQIDSILNLNSTDIGKAKRAAEEARDKYKADLEAAQETLKGFEGVDVNGLNARVSDYEAQMQTLRDELNAEKASAALKIALFSANAEDADYISYKLGEKLRAEGKTLELDNAGNIKDWDALLNGLKAQFPHQFKGGGKKHYEEKKLQESDENGSDEPSTLEDALRGFYEQDTQ